jgi:hypothetical protein
MEIQSNDQSLDDELAAELAAIDWKEVSEEFKIFMKQNTASQKNTLNR